MPFAGRDIAARFLQVILALDGTVWVACAVLMLLLFVASRGALALRGRWPFVLGLALPAIAGLAWAWQLRWVADDAFITFRYADNFARGLGPVWNAGERVEGYTDPLWMAMLAVAIRLGADPVRVAFALSLGSFGASLAVVRWITRLPSAGAGVPPPVVSPAVLLLVTNYAFVTYATSGLETMCASTLALAALAAALSGRPMLAGFAGIAATLMHPDHALLYVALGAALLLERRGWRPLVRYATPFVVFFVPCWAVRWAYYGWPLPNTFYAKDAPGFYATQGGNYLLVCALGGGLAAVTLVAVASAVRLHRTLLGRYYLAAFVLLVVYILKIGGDFMMGRLLVALAPPAAVLAELFLRRLAARGRTAPWAFGAAALLALGALPARIIKPWEKAWGIADERTFYSLRTVHPLDIDSKYPGWGRRLGERFGAATPPVTIAFDAIGMVGYLSRLRIVDIMGLTEPAVAHRPLTQRGRPGHERNASTAYMLDRGIELSNRRIYPQDYDAYTKLEVDDGLSLYRASARDIPGAARLADSQAAIDAYTPEGRDAPQRACDLWFFREFYFGHERDEARWASLVDKLVNAGALDPLAARFLQHPGDFTRAATLEWARGESTTQGDAFDESPTTTWPSSQDEPRGYEGACLDTFTSRGGDDARGSLRSRSFEIVGDLLEFHVGGGKDASSLAVRLVVGDEVVASATGCGSELMSERVWRSSRWRGQTGHIEVIDDHRGSWGHVVVDRIAQWTLR